MNRWKLENPKSVRVYIHVYIYTVNWFSNIRTSIPNNLLIQSVWGGGGFLSNSFRFASTFLVAISSGYSVELFLVFGLWYSNQFTTLFRETRYINFKWMNLVSSMSIAGPNEMEPIKSENHWRTNNRLSWNYTRCPWWFRFSPKPCIWFVWHKWHKISNGCSHWLIIEMESNLQMEMKMYEVDDASISWMIIDVKPRNSHHL